MSRFIKDTIHGEIEVSLKDSFIFDLLSTREMKRLRNIYQLGECHNIFFNAVHTRYMHSIGVYHNALTFINKLELSPEQLPENDRRAIIAAAILHDIGHGPRSHFFECLANFSHEAMTIKIIEDSTTEVHKVLVKNNISIKDIIAIIKKEHKKKFYWQIISSQIDADRLDYLLRDSHFTGINYGNIEPGVVFQWSSVRNNEIVFDYKAIGAIEDILFSRWQMFKLVYCNDQVLCYEHLLHKIFIQFKVLVKNQHKLKDSHKLYYLLNPYVYETEWEIDNFMKLDESSLRMILLSLHEENDDVLHDLVDAYLYNQKYQCSDEYNFDIDSKQWNELINTHSTIVYNSKEPIFIKQIGEPIEITEYSPTFLKVNKDKVWTTKVYFHYKN